MTYPPPLADLIDVNPLRPRPLQWGPRQRCSPETPYDGQGMSFHPQARKTDGGGGSDRYECPVCGLTWAVELPD